VAHSIENASRVLAAENFDALDRYRKGDVTAYLGLHARTTNDEYCLAFFRVSSFSENGGVIRGGTVSRLERDGALIPWCSEIEGNETAVFLSVSDLGESPEGIIPSFVSLEPFKDRTDFRRQSLAAAGQVVPKVEFGRPEWELGGLQRGAFSCEGGSVTSLIQDGPEVVGCVEKNARQHLWPIARELDFVHMFSGLRILINEVGPWLVIDKTFDNRFEVADMVLCPTERQTWAVERSAMAKISDPTKEPEFQKVVQSFLRTFREAEATNALIDVLVGTLHTH
jgi:hypothetical protein